ncbi:hypothetical protein ACIGW0_26905 [Streptomyces bikiniensis]|uniref:DUF1963 domain-containing protein n=1 Tax=Streptomyces bikiniensis TaxID=1896 RepID=A0ABW8CZE0_STRBI
MPLPADRTALDLTDALMEALRDGRDLPQGPDVPVVEEGGEPVRRVLDRLRRIPREPADDFVRHVGTLLMEFRSRRRPWNAAALRLFEDPYAFAATGPRRHEDWTYDVHAVTCRPVPDPRGWTHVDGDRFNGVRRALPSYPFDPPAPDFLAAGLQGTRTHRFLTSEGLDGLYFFEGLGAIAVSDHEVGVFWSFGAC